MHVNLVHSGFEVTCGRVDGNLEMETSMETYKSKWTFPLTQLHPALPNYLQTVPDRCLRGDEEGLSVDFIAKPCLLELTQEGGSLHARPDHPVSRLQPLDWPPQTDTIGTGRQDR